LWRIRGAFLMEWIPFLPQKVEAVLKNIEDSFELDNL